MSPAAALWLSLLLLLGNAFFVGAEFAAMAARRSPARADGGRRQHDGPRSASTRWTRSPRCSPAPSSASPSARWASAPSRRPPCTTCSSPVLHGCGPVRGARAPDRAGAGAARVWPTCTSSSARWCPRTSPSPARTGPRCCSCPPLLYITAGAAAADPADGVGRQGLVRAARRRAQGRARRPRSPPRRCSTSWPRATREGLIEEEQHGLVTGALEFSDQVAGDVGGPADRARHPPRRRDPGRRRAAGGQARVLPVPVRRRRRRADRLPAPQGHPVRRRGRARRSRSRSSGCAGWPRSAPATRSRTCWRPCSARARTWPGSSTPTARGRGRVPRGRARGAGRGGHRRHAAPAGPAAPLTGEGGGVRRPMPARGGRPGSGPARGRKAESRRWAQGRHEARALLEGGVRRCRGRASAPRSPRGRNEAPPAGFEPALPPPEGGALSPELRGPARAGGLHPHRRQLLRHGVSCAPDDSSSLGWLSWNGAQPTTREICPPPTGQAAAAGSS